MKFPMGSSINDAPMFQSELGFFVPKSAVETAMADPTMRAAIDRAAAEAKRQSGINAAASLVAGQAAPSPYYPSPSTGLPGWLLPVGLGVGALALYMVLKK